MDLILQVFFCGLLCDVQFPYWHGPTFVKQTVLWYVLRFFFIAVLCWLTRIPPSSQSPPCLLNGNMLSSAGWRLHHQVNCRSTDLGHESVRPATEAHCILLQVHIIKNTSEGWFTFSEGEGKTNGERWLVRRRSLRAQRSDSVVLCWTTQRADNNPTPPNPIRHPVQTPSPTLRGYVYRSFPYFTTTIYITSSYPNT